MRLTQFACVFPKCARACICLQANVLVCVRAGEGGVVCVRCACVRTGACEQVRAYVFESFFFVNLNSINLGL